MKKGITLLGVLIAMLAVTSGAFAAHHYLITSSNQIKDGVVSLSDLSPAARQALQGQKRSTAAAGPQGPAGATGARGPQGPAGATGANGARGPQGQAGVTGYEVHTWRYSKDDANSDMGPGYGGVGGGAIATVACSPGKVALGGGYRFTSADDERVQLAGPLGREWRDRVVPWSHGLDHNHGQAERQLGLDRAGQRQGEPRRSDVVRHLRKRELGSGRLRMLALRRGYPGPVGFFGDT